MNIRPVLRWLPELEQKIKQVKVAVIFVGKEGFGPWQEIERQELTCLLVRKKGHHVIPVFFENTPVEDTAKNLDLLGLLEGNFLIDFRKQDPKPLNQLIWGITGKYPTKVYRPGVLIASLSDAPMVVSTALGDPRPGDASKA